MDKLGRSLNKRAKYESEEEEEDFNFDLPASFGGPNLNADQNLSALDRKKNAKETKSDDARNTMAYCASCLNKFTYFQINFDESIKICLNTQCTKYENDLALENLLPVEEKKYNSGEFIHSDEFRKHDLKKICDFFENDEKVNSLKFYSSLNLIMAKIIEKKTQVSNLQTLPVLQQQQPPQITTEILENQPEFYLDQNSLGESFMDYPEMHSIFTSQLNQIQPEVVNPTETQFNDHFPIESLLDLDLTDALFSPETLQTPVVVESGANAAQTMPSQTFVDIKTKEDANLAQNYLYRGSFLERENLAEPSTPQVIADVKSKTGSGIKIVKLNKKVEPARVFVDDSVKKRVVAEEKEDKGEKLLGWEIKSTTRRRGLKKLNEKETIFKSSGELTPKQAIASPSILLNRNRLSSNITKADLSTKAQEQKSHFIEKGTMLKRALLEDQHFLSQSSQSESTPIKQSDSGGKKAPSGGYKNLVLSVLKKKPVS